MLGKKTTTPVYEDKVKNAKYDCIHKALTDIVALEIKVLNPTTNKEEINYPQTVSAIRTRARLVLDFVKNLDKQDDN